MQATNIKEHIDDMAALSQSLSGRLSAREVRFLALAAATLPPSLDEVPEIASFKGKSTTALAKSVALVGGDRVYAVDPLFLPSATVSPVESGESLPNIFRDTIAADDVQYIVASRQVPSDKLAVTWHRSLYLLCGGVNASEWQPTTAKNLPNG